MAWAFDLERENNDYRQRTAVVFCALFERDFLEDFYTVLEELFNGNYSIEGLKKAVCKNKMYLLKERQDIKPVITKDNGNSAAFTNTVLKTIALLFLLGEVYFEIQDNIENNGHEIKLEQELTVLSDTIITIESQRSIYLGILRENRLKLKDYNAISSKLEELDDVFINECRSIKNVIQTIENNNEYQNGNIKQLCKGITDTISSILRGRELERKLFGNTNINRSRFQ